MLICREEGVKFFASYFFTLYFFKICAKIKNDSLVVGVKIFDCNKSKNLRF